MNLSRPFLLALLTAGIAGAQETPAPAQSEMQKWIATTDEGWQAVFKRDVTDAHEAEVNKLKLQYLNLLDQAVAKASKASDLDGALALRNEQKRFSDTEFFLETDEAGDAAPVKQVRATLRALLAQAEKNHAARAKALLAKYDALLADAQAQLTKVQRLDDAVLVKKQREQVAAAWGPSAAAAAAGNSTAPTTATPPARTQPAVSPKVVTTKPSPAPTKGVAKDDIIKALVGTWHFHWTETGFDADFRFTADGKFTGLPDGHKGTWTMADDKIVMEAPGAAEKIMHFPLDPSGTKVNDKRKNRNVVAVKNK